MPCQQVGKLVNECEILSAVGLSGEIDKNQGREIVVEAKTTELISRQGPMSVVSDDAAHHHKDTHILECLDNVTSPLVRGGRRYLIKKQKLAHTVSNHVRIIRRAHGTKEWKFLRSLLKGVIVIPILELLIAVDGVEKIPGGTLNSGTLTGTHIGDRQCLIGWFRHDERTEGRVGVSSKLFEIVKSRLVASVHPVPKFSELRQRFLEGTLRALESPQEH